MKSDNKETTADMAPGNSIYGILGMEFVYIPPGSFLMGSPESEEGRYPDEAQHEVTITRGYYLKSSPVTQVQWKSVMGNNPSLFIEDGSNCPVESVSWDEVQTFIDKLNKRDNSNRFRLPTEAE